MISLLRKAFALHPPPAMRFRLLRWMGAAAAREFAWALLLATLAVIAILVGLGATGSTAGIVALVALAAVALWLARLARQSLTSAGAVREALAELEPPDDEERSDFPLSHLLFPPLMLWPRGVSHVRGVEFARYGDRPLRLDVYQPKAPAPGLRPAIVQVHGGGWVVGTRAEQGIPLLNHLAVHGWVGFNIDYRLSPAATFPDHLVDVKRAIAWVREHAADYGADPEFICLTGGSAGGHLCALAALTADDPAFQPGFEDADTSVAAAVPFYGVYDLTDSEGIYYSELLEWVLEGFVFKAPLADHRELYRSASPTHRVHSGGAAVLRPARRPRHAGPGRRRTPLRARAARRVARAGRLRRARRGRARLRHRAEPEDRTGGGDDRALPGHDQGARTGDRAGRSGCRAPGCDRLGSPRPTSGGDPWT